MAGMKVGGKVRRPKKNKGSMGSNKGKKRTGKGKKKSAY